MLNQSVASIGQSVAPLITIPWYRTLCVAAELVCTKCPCPKHFGRWNCGPGALLISRGFRVPKFWDTDWRTADALAFTIFPCPKILGHGVWIISYFLIARCSFAPPFDHLISFTSLIDNLRHVCDCQCRHASARRRPHAGMDCQCPYKLDGGYGETAFMSEWIRSGTQRRLV